MTFQMTMLKRLTPPIARNRKGKANYDRLGRLLTEQSSSPLVLVLGGGILGAGMSSLLSYGSVELVETDVSFAPRTKLICDAHDIPFANESFDGMVVQVVLEHVADPSRCVDEIHRVLKRDGLVYAELPFMWQVHSPRYDFTRFSNYGLRRLFRGFKETELGINHGPATALALAYNTFFSASAVEARTISGCSRDSQPGI